MNFPSKEQSADSTVIELKALKDRCKRIARAAVPALILYALLLLAGVLFWMFWLPGPLMTSFVDLDLPNVVQATGQPTRLESLVIEFTSSTTVRVLIMVLFVASSALSMTSGSILPAIIMIPIVTAAALIPQISGELSPAVQDNLSIQRLASEKRYDELAANTSMLPLAEGAYVKAQIAYLTGDKATLTDALEAMAGAPTSPWKPDWQRMSVMETMAFGAPSSPTQASIDAMEAVNATLRKRFTAFVFTMLFTGAVVAFLGGFHRLLTRRIRRLETMLAELRAPHEALAQAPAAPSAAPPHEHSEPFDLPLMKHKPPEPRSSQAKDCPTNSKAMPTGGPLVYAVGASVVCPELPPMLQCESGWTNNITDDASCASAGDENGFN